MFKYTYQSGFLSVFYSLGNKPLQLWGLSGKAEDASIKRVTDEDIQSSVLEITCANLATCYMSCPADPAKSLGIKLHYFVMLIKNLGKFFSFEVEILDDLGERRRFRASNYQIVTRTKPYICTMPLRLEGGWNQVVVNLHDFTKRAYGTNYVETRSIRVHSNCRLRRIFFAEELFGEDDLPNEFKLFLPVQKA